MRADDRPGALAERAWQLSGPQRTVLAGVFIAGALGYLRAYLANRSLWYDEALLALELIDRKSLLEPFHRGQAVPVGFAALTSAAMHVFGSASEHVLRVWSVVAAVLVPPAVYLAARQIVSGWPAILATAIVATAPSLLYFSSEFKPYALDVFFSAAILAAAGQHLRTGGRARTLWMFTALSAVGVWMSFPSIIVIAAACLAMVSWSRARQWSGVRPLAIAIAAVGVSFVEAYAVSSGVVARVSDLQTYWSEFFPPLPPRSFNDLAVWLSRALALFSEPFAAPVNDGNAASQATLLVLALWLGGVVWSWRRDRWSAILLAAPLAATLAIAALHLYPAGGRLILFLLPVLAIGASAGVDALGARAPWPALLASVLLLLLPTLSFMQSARHPSSREEVRAALAALDRQVQRGDVVYLFARAVPTTDYYRRVGMLPPREDVAVITGKSHHGTPTGYFGELCALTGHERIWLVMAHPLGTVLRNEAEFLVATLRGVDAVTRDFTFQGASLYLLDFSKAPVRRACGE